MKKVLVPKVRFKGFSEDWKEERFDNIFFNIQEKNKNRYSIKEYISVASNTWKKDVNIKNKQTLWNYSVFRVGDIAYEGHTNEAFPFGRFVINRIGTGIISNIFTVFRPKADLSLDFSQYWVNNNLVMIGLLKRSSKSGIMMNSLTLENVNEEKISLPKYSEQQKIGKLLDQISNLITLEEIKINKLKQLKKTLLEKMFPEGNSKTPIIRFKGFEGEWKEEKLEYIAKVTNGKSNTSDNNKWGQYNLYIRSEEIYKSNKYIFDVEGVITVGDGNIGKIFHYVNGKFDLHQRCYLIYEFQNIWPKYFYYYFSQNFYKRAILMSYTATVNSIRMNTITDMDIMFPKELIEQQKIGDFFCKIDTLINLYQSKLKKLKKIKEALLQKMFV
ncbi:restriction endonuclease subunit S [Mycoplasmopsis felis]|uniref:restriction endonuclease subunit S n=1 Tax=Mycoplasmopsis felis TaxID=33923 RepID=UPI002AF6C6AA|nr:restriction endonuclease subunit S [Mycoplasmopsis felis]WQQ02098.1 restriction endonuclease subunit S [Mycoplasmopsis felis]